MSWSVWKNRSFIDILKTNLVNQMAGPCTHCNSSSESKDRLAESILRAFTENNSTCILSLVVSRAQNPTPAQKSALTPTLDLPSIYTDVNLQKTTKLALELFFKGQKHIIKFLSKSRDLWLHHYVFKPMQKLLFISKIFVCIIVLLSCL